MGHSEYSRWQWDEMRRIVKELHIGLESMPGKRFIYLVETLLYIYRNPEGMEDECQSACCQGGTGQDKTA